MVTVPPGDAYDNEETRITGDRHNDVLIDREMHQLLLTSNPDILGDPLAQEDRIIDWTRQRNPAETTDRKRRYRSHAGQGSG